MSDAILHDTDHVLVARMDRVRKTWKGTALPYSSAIDEAEFYRLAAGIPGIPPLIEHGKDFIVLPYIPKNFGNIKNLSADKRRKMGFKIVDIIFEMFCRGVAHSDLYISNILLSEDEQQPCLIDPMINFYGSHTKFCDCFDLCGMGLEPKLTTEKKIQCCFDNFAGPELGITHEEAVGYIADKLYSAMINCSGTETYNDLAPKGITYSSINFPGLFKCDGWRDTDKRFAELGITSLKEKTVLDLGSCLGAFLFKSAQMGALLAVGLEKNADRIRIANRLAAFLGLRNRVKSLGAEASTLTREWIMTNAKQDSFDVSFCMALEGRVSPDAGILPLLAQVTRETMYYETNHVHDNPPARYMDMIKKAGFKVVQHVGTEDEGFPKRYKFVCHKGPVP